MRWYNLRARVQLSVAIAHGLDFQHDMDGLGISDEEKENVAEAVWYMPFQYALNILFSSHPFITVNPQRAIKNLFWSNDKGDVVVQKLIPDYMVFLSQCKIIKDSLKLVRTAVIMIVEQKPTPRPRQRLNGVRRSAWSQALDQATYVLRNSGQKAVGVMVAIGITWSYSTIRRNNTSEGLPETDSEKPYIPPQSGEDSHDSEDSSCDIRKTGVRRELLSILPTSKKSSTNAPRRRITSTVFERTRASRRPFSRSHPATAKRQSRPSTARSTRRSQGDAGPSNRTGSGNHSVGQAQAGLGPDDDPGESFLEAFDHSKPTFYTLGTRPSDLALEDVLETLKDLPDFQTEEWQASFDSNRHSQFRDVEAMFERLDSE